jgi:5-methylcytosine-specific restriction endonuclease McrA
MKINATPPWLTDEQKKDIKNLYFECKIISDTTGVKHHIDHIIPLNNELVCGLHVPWNLQILTAKDNLIKSNII